MPDELRFISVAAGRSRKTLTTGPINVLVLFMFTPPDRTEAQDRMLAEFAELVMDLGLDAARRVKESQDGAEAAALMLAVDRLGRSLRLTTVLQRRLRREARADRAEAVETRRQQVRTVLAPELRATTRHLGERFELETELDERLAEEALDEAFADIPLDACLDRLRDLVGLPAIPFPLYGGRAWDGGGALSTPLRPEDPGTTKTTKGVLARAGPS
jgi:hypothetical protein